MSEFTAVNIKCITLYEVVSGLSDDVYKCTRGRENAMKTL